MICPNCQKEIPDTAKACGYCGRWLGGEKPATVAKQNPPWLWIGLGVAALVVVVGALAYLFGRGGSPVNTEATVAAALTAARQEDAVAAVDSTPTPTEPSAQPTPTAPPPTAATPPEPTATPTQTPTPRPPTRTPTPKPTNTPTLTPTPRPTNTPRPTPTPTATIDADPTVYDNFNNPAFDGKWNTGRWSSSSESTNVEQKNGILILSRQSPDSGGLSHWPNTINELNFVEAKLMLDRNIQASGGDIGIGLSGLNDWWLNCSIYGEQGSSNAWANCGTVDGFGDNGRVVEYNSWHTMRLEINPDTATITFFVDGQQIDNYPHPNPEGFKKAQLSLNLSIWSQDGGSITGYIDDVRIGKLGQ